MSVPRWFYYLIAVAFALLFFVLGWGWWAQYKSECKRVQEEVNSIAHKTASHVQNTNYGSYDILRALADKDYKEKVAFAAGITQNQSKMTVSFAVDDSESTKVKPVETNKNGDSLKLTVNPKGAKPITIVVPRGSQNGANHYVPPKLKSIKYYDSLFAAELGLQGLNISYHIEQVAASAKPVALATDLFIIDFYDPVVYRIVYHIPASLLLVRLLPYTLAVVFLLLLLSGALVLFYKSYRLQLQMAQFKESLFSNVTHELKTPLSSLQLIIHSFKSDSAGMSAKQQEYIDFAGRELQRMNLLTEKILSFGKLDQQQFALNKELIDVAALISEAIQIMDISLRDKNAQIIFEPVDNLEIVGDRILLLNMIVSIIDNAVKYNTNVPHIHISVHSENKLVKIVVADNGIGIAPQYSARIFHPFFRVPTGNEHSVKGHGLGLSFAQQVAVLHGGKISLESKAGNGSSFIIFMPL